MIGDIDSNDFEANFQEIYTKESAKIKMKCDQSISLWKEDLASKMKDINSYENQLLVGNFPYLLYHYMKDFMRVNNSAIS